MKFTLNGNQVDYNDDLNISLLKYLRNIAGITTPKEGCSGQAYCGSCTVLVDDKPTLSCVTQMKKIEGKVIVTTDGLDQKLQEIFSIAFVEKGGIQCGFCTPGIVMSAAALLKKNPHPTREDAINAINRNLCRCTGYHKIIDSIIYASEIIQGKAQLPSKKSLFQKSKLGESQPKYDSYKTVLGMRPFVCDMFVPNMHFAALKLSDHPRAKVLKIDYDEALQVVGVKKIITAKDIPGKQYIGLIVRDWPVLISEGQETHYLGDALAIVVATSEEIARSALVKIKVQYEVLDPVVDVDLAQKADSPIVHPKIPHASYSAKSVGNILSVCHVERGNINEGKKNSAFIAEGTYHTQRIEHAFLEPECALAIPNPPSDYDHNLALATNKNQYELLLYSQGQGAYEDRKQVAEILNLPLEKVRVIQVANGGGFGGKEDLTVQGHASLAAHLLKVPVKVTLTREESMLVHPKRHPMRLKFKVGCDKKGMLTFLEADIVGDSGAYASVGMKVLERAAGHAAGPYVIPNVDVVAKAIYTNNVPCGAMRGFGANQAAFAIESSIDELCEEGGFDRWQFRYNNSLTDGDTFVTGQVLEGGVGVRQSLLALKDLFYKSKYAGLACGIKNCGVGNGMADIGRIKIEIKSADHIIIKHGWSEMGQGVHTMAIQFFSEETNIDPAKVSIEVRVDTDDDIVTGMTTSSRATSLIGHAIIEASKKLKEDLKSKSLSELVGQTYFAEWICNWTTKPGYEKPGEKIVTHYSYSYSAQLVTLKDDGEIDTIYVAQDAGKIVNKTLFEGQIEGAVHMGLGYALTEDFPYKDGRPVVTKFNKCGIIPAKKTPDVKVIGIEVSDPHGPHGAKGVGEIGLVPTAAAVANAFYQFDKIKRYSLPLKKNDKTENN
ncbi:MAG: selenium-dependent xanthine dehydrogenase [Oligoflexia bacterium]|nr:selenium-dependent xanthine dehydrogenase [Oligoflexia bacterium]